MQTAKNVKLNVKGDIQGSNVIVGDHNISLGEVNGGIVNIIQQKEQEVFEPLPRPVGLRPRPIPNFLNRISEIEKIKLAFKSSMPVSLFGENGIGKTSLLRQIAYVQEANQFADGIVYILANDEGCEDLLQLIFDAFYKSNLNIKPTETQIRTYLKSTRALIILDDIKLQREDTQFLLDAVPNSVFIFTSLERSLWGDGYIIALDGLPENESLQLFVRELGRNLKDDEIESAKKICATLFHHPLRILQTASMIREDGLGIPMVLSTLTNAQAKSPVLEATLEKSNETQKKILSLLAVAGGYMLTREHLASLAGNIRDEDLQPLIKRGFVSEAESGFTLSGEAVISLTSMWDLSGWEDALLNHLGNWLQSAPQGMLVDKLADTLFYLIQRAGEKKQWKHVVIIGKWLERLYALKKKWQGWLKILNLLRMAAQALGDKYLQGWVLHQMGSRSMCLGAKAQAQEFLKQALEVRKAIGDKAGLQATQHNMNVLMNVPTPIQQATPNPKPSSQNLTRIFVGGTTVVAVTTALVLAGMYFYPFSEPEPTATPTATEAPTSTLTITPVPTITATPTPQKAILFDFVREADKAEWSYIPSVSILEFFQDEIIFNPPLDGSSPESYVSLNGSYVGWERVPRLEDTSIEDDLVLLTYPSGSKIQGYYYLENVVLQAGDELVLHVGHKYPDGEFPISPFVVTFRVYYLTNDESFLLAEIEDRYDGKTQEMQIEISEKLYGTSGTFILEADSQGDPFFDWGAWINATLEGLPR